ncbi:MAG: hypothetical protein OEL87_00995 [Nanoarchaeota archaeon]|nr:hypothetical protein [Nanoarchaeota archaeon]
MIDIQEKKRKIISFLEKNGPSLPVRIAKAIEMDPVFASAIASELLGSKQIKTSYMKIGASPLYLLPGQEKRLEEHTEHLKSVEKEAYLKIKNEKTISDEEESPAIRVALRNIKDFATPFKFQEKIMWKYSFSADEEIKKILSGPEQNAMPEPKAKEAEPTNKKPIPEAEEPKSEKEELEIRNKKKESETTTEREESTEVPKAWEVKKEEIKEIKEKSKKIENIFTESELEEEKPEFLTETKKFLKQKNIEFVEEIRTEKKEIMSTVSITSQLGKINFLLIAKNKKTTTKDEIDAAIQIATKNKMPCLLIIRKSPSRPIQKLIDENHLIKLEIMEESLNL